MIERTIGLAGGYPEIGVICLGEGHAEKGVATIATHCRYMIECERIANIGMAAELLRDIVWLA